MRHPDAPPEVERTVDNVRRWGDLAPGDVLRSRGLPATISRIEDGIPLTSADFADILSRINERRSKQVSRGWINGVPYEQQVKPWTMSDLREDDYEWGPVAKDPRTIEIWCTREGWKTERRLTNPVPVRGNIRGARRGLLVAVGPDAHFETCGRCGFLWPCPHRTMEGNVQAVLRSEAEKCTHCGERVRSGQHIVKATLVDEWGPQEARFHGKKGPCLNAALRLDPENVAEQRARYDEELDRMKAWRARPGSRRSAGESGTG